MAGNRPMQRLGKLPAQEAFSLRSGRGHEFQNDMPHDLPLDRLARTPRNIFAKSTRIYRGDKLGAGRFFTQIIFSYVTGVVQLILPQAERSYLLIQNLDAAANLFVGFGLQPTTTVGLKIIPGTAFEPYVVPSNDIFICGDANGTATILFGAIGG